MDDQDLLKHTTRRWIDSDSPARLCTLSFHSMAFAKHRSWIDRALGSSPTGGKISPTKYDDTRFVKDDCLTITLLQRSSYVEGLSHEQRNREIGTATDSFAAY